MGSVSNIGIVNFVGAFKVSDWQGHTPKTIFQNFKVMKRPLERFHNLKFWKF